MKFSILLSICFMAFWSVSEKTRIIEYNGKAVNTTFDVPQNFFGTYKGKKKGFLLLREDGTGQYNYDIFGFAPADCSKGVIEVEWGFLLDENGSIVSFPREYGKSYPILMKSTGASSFQGCRKEVLLDFIMDYENGILGVSSSDDWIKE